jgi:DNA-binding NarL/FixJ family response regulator
MASRESLRESAFPHPFASALSHERGSMAATGRPGQGLGGVVRVLVVAPPSVLRDAVVEGIDGRAGCRCVGVVALPEEVASRGIRHPADVVLLEARFDAGPAGLEALKVVAVALPRAQILVWTDCGQPATVVSALECGASGYLLKSSSVLEILQAVQEVHRGGAPMSPAVARIVVMALRARRTAAPAEHLTCREAEILALVARGYLNKEIACRLSIGFETVRSHLKSIYEKLHVRSRTSAAVKYFRDTIPAPSLDTPAAMASGLTGSCAAPRLPRAESVAKARTPPSLP